MDELKLYAMDCSWCGGITVIAKSLEQAKDLMSKEYNYDETNEIVEHPITEGLVVTFLGDS